MQLNDNKKETGSVSGFAIGRLLPVVLLLAGLILFFVLDLDHYVTFETIREQRHWLTSQVTEFGIFAVMVFVVAYGVAVAFSLPVGLLFSLTGGFLFGEWLGTLYSVIGATLGATVLFMVARSALGDPLRERAGPWLSKVERGFADNALSYLLVLRLIVVFPFWVVNLVPAFLGVPLGTYVLGTFIGVIPGAFVINLAGAGLGAIFDTGEAFSPANVFTPEIIGALAGLAILALLPALRGRWKARRRDLS
jgi:uncharacterized membrane protein YdjX (TVP38/TMEM64 family)